MAVLSFREALGQAMEEEMAADESIFLMGSAATAPFAGAEVSFFISASLSSF